MITFKQGDDFDLSIYSDGKLLIGGLSLDDAEELCKALTRKLQPKEKTKLLVRAVWKRAEKNGYQVGRGSSLRVHKGVERDGNRFVLSYKSGKSIKHKTVGVLDFIFFLKKADRTKAIEVLREYLPEDWLAANEPT